MVEKGVSMKEGLVGSTQIILWHDICKGDKPDRSGFYLVSIRITTHDAFYSSELNSFDYDIDEMYYDIYRDTWEPYKASKHDHDFFRNNDADIIAWTYGLTPYTGEGAIYDADDGDSISVQEYIALKEKYIELKKATTQFEASPYLTGGPIPRTKCPYDLLRDQQRALGEYLHILEVRAIVEGEDLE